MFDRVFFTSDNHFGHRSILHLGNGRPFETVEEMDSVMIERWNATVGPLDEIWFLGDFTFYNSTKTNEILEQLNGRKHAVWGNHDKEKGIRKKTSFFESTQEYAEIEVADQHLVLFHFPIASWHHVGKGAYHLHGHCHSNLEDTDMRRLDVGVDGHTFYPWSFDEIDAILKDRYGLPGDHHDH